MSNRSLSAILLLRDKAFLLLLLLLHISDLKGIKQR